MNVSGMKLFGTNHRFDLTNVAFSCRGAFISVYENKTDHCLYVTHCRSENTMLQRPDLMRMAFIGYGGEALPFTYEADESSLKVTTKEGFAEFTYETARILRIRVRGILLRFFVEPELHEGAHIRSETELEAGFNFLGKLLFKCIAGRFYTNAAWNFREVRPFPYIIDIAPQGIDGELAIHEYYSSGKSNEKYIRFEEAKAQMKASFEDFLKSYPKVPLIYEQTARQYAWVVWTSLMGPVGSLKKTSVYMHKLLLVRAFGWHQSYAALSMTENVGLAWELLLSFFDHQDEQGGIPDNIGDVNQNNYISTKPPLFGYAICKILEGDVSALKASDFSEMFHCLSKYRSWWFIHHDHAKTGYPSYYHVDESGYDEASLFFAGLPLQAPDLMAYMVLLDEALSKLAQLLGNEKAAQFHENESKRVLKFLTDELWDSENKKFRAKIVKTGEWFDCECAAMLQPILLGKRLPEQIIAAIRDRALNEDEFLTDYGVASESQKSDQFSVKSFTRGPVIAPVNMQIISGLLDAGETDAAIMLSVRYLNSLVVNGCVLGTCSNRMDGYERLEKAYSENPIGAPFTAWAGSIFLYLAGRLQKELG